jgi:hypothetical protein
MTVVWQPETGSWAGLRQAGCRTLAALGGRIHTGLRFGFNFDRIQDFEGYGRFCREHNFAIAG